MFQLYVIKDCWFLDFQEIQESTGEIKALYSVIETGNWAKPSSFFSKKKACGWGLSCKQAPYLSDSWSGWTAPPQGRADPEQSPQFHSSSYSEQSQTVPLRKEASFSDFYLKSNFASWDSETESFRNEGGQLEELK